MTQAVSPLAQEAGGNSEDEEKPCCENAIAHETDRKSEPACWRAATGSLMNSYSMEASKVLRSTVLTSLASQILSVRVWLATRGANIFVLVKIHKPRDIHMTSDARLLCLQSDWFRQHSGANAKKHQTYFYHSPFPCARPQRAHANTYGPRD